MRGRRGYVLQQPRPHEATSEREPRATETAARKAYKHAVSEPLQVAAAALIGTERVMKVKASAHLRLGAVAIADRSRPPLVYPFVAPRQPAAWRGVGSACHDGITSADSRSPATRARSRR